MKSKLVLGLLLTLLFIGVLMLAFRIQPVKAWIGGTITIEQLGGVSPEGAPISSSDNITYTLDDDIVCTETLGIWVKRDNIIIDGADHILQGTGSGTGIDLYGRTNVTIKDMEIKDCGWIGIQVNNSSDVTISGNNITNNGISGIMVVNFSRYNTIIGNNISANFNCSIWIYLDSEHNRVSENNIANNVWGVNISRSTNNVVSGNNITDNGYGIGLSHSDVNNVFENNITNNNCGVKLHTSSFNMFCYNNFINNAQQVDSDPNYANFWNISYPHRGNYWSDQPHGYWSDIYQGPNQDNLGIDGIVDSPYEFDALNKDRLPLKYPWTPIRTSVSMGPQVYPVAIVSNSSISNIQGTGGRVLRFDSSGQTGEKGCILVIFPKDVEPRPEVRINNAPPPYPFPTIHDNGTLWFIYIEITFSSTCTIDIQFSPTVGGIYIPVNKLSLLAPYIALTLTIILAVSISVAYIKHRKKQ